MPLRFLWYLFINSFLLSFLWEVSQMPLFNSMGQGQREDVVLFIKIHWAASIKDALIILAIYLIVALLSKNFYWGRHWTRRGLAPLLILSFCWAAGLEYYHLNINHSWSYNTLMPLLPFLKIGLMSVLQMIVIPPLAIIMARRHLFS